MHKQQRRQKKGDTTFDVWMSSYDVAETYKQLGSFLLSQLQNRNLPRRQIGHFKHHTERYRKHQKGNMPHLQSHGLRITIVANEKTIDFLEVTFNLNKSTYQPFTKPNTTLKYVHHERNHPPTTTKNIPTGINERLSSLSSDKAFFDQATSPYQKALEKCGYRYTLYYEPPTTNKRKNRQRNNILWYKLLFSKNVNTNIRPDSLT